MFILAVVFIKSPLICCSDAHIVLDISQPPLIDSFLHMCHIGGKLSITGRRVAMAAAYEYHGPQSLLTSLKGLVHSACVAADFM